MKNGVFQELGLGPSIPVHVVMHDWIRHADGKLSFHGFVKLLHGVSSRTLRKVQWRCKAMPPASWIHWIFCFLWQNHGVECVAELSLKPEALASAPSYKYSFIRNCKSYWFFPRRLSCEKNTIIFWGQWIKTWIVVSEGNFLHVSYICESCSLYSYLCCICKFTFSRSIPSCAAFGTKWRFINEVFLRTKIKHIGL